MGRSNELLRSFEMWHFEFIALFNFIHQHWWIRHSHIYIFREQKYSKAGRSMKFMYIHNTTQYNQSNCSFIYIIYSKYWTFQCAVMYTNHKFMGKVRMWSMLIFTVFFSPFSSFCPFSSASSHHSGFWDNADCTSVYCHHLYCWTYARWKTYRMHTHSAHTMSHYAVA